MFGRWGVTLDRGNGLSDATIFDGRPSRKFLDGGQLAQMTTRKVNLQIHEIGVKGPVSDLRLASKYFVRDPTKSLSLRDDWIHPLPLITGYSSEATDLSVSSFGPHPHIKCGRSCGIWIFSLRTGAIKSGY